MRPFFLLLAICLALQAAAEEAKTEALVKPGPGPKLSLDRLLRPPAPLAVVREARGGKDRVAWEPAFIKTRSEIQQLEGRIQTGQAQLREVQGPEWGFTPSGGGQPTDPELLRLRASLRRDRQSLKGAHQRLRDLEVEASLAGVPEGWRDVLPPPTPVLDPPAR